MKTSFLRSAVRGVLCSLLPLLALLFPVLPVAAAQGGQVGASFEYANTNYSVLGLLVQTVSGQAYETYVQQHIFAPLQMSHSFASEQDARGDGLAQGYQVRFGVPVPTTLPSPRDLLPAGYLISTAGDMAHYLIAQLNGGRFEHTAVLSYSAILPARGRHPVPDQQGIRR